MAQLADAYLERHLKENVPSWFADQRLMRTHLKPALGRSPIAEVSQTDLANLRGRVARTFPADARRLKSLLSDMFDWAAEHGLWSRSSREEGSARPRRLTSRQAQSPKPRRARGRSPAVRRGVDGIPARVGRAAPGVGGPSRRGLVQRRRDAGQAQRAGGGPEGARGRAGEQPPAAGAGQGGSRQSAGSREGRKADGESAPERRAAHGSRRARPKASAASWPRSSPPRRPGPTRRPRRWSLWRACATSSRLGRSRRSARRRFARCSSAGPGSSDSPGWRPARSAALSLTLLLQIAFGPDGYSFGACGRQTRQWADHRHRRRRGLGGWAGAAPPTAPEPATGAATSPPATASTASEPSTGPRRRGGGRPRLGSRLVRAAGRRLSGGLLESSSCLPTGWGTASGPPSGSNRILRPTSIRVQVGAMTARH